MLREERLELSFERAHVQNPLVCEMARRHPDVLFNIRQLSVGPHEARMQISLIGEVPDLRAVREYFASLGVDVRLIEELKHKAPIPQVPRRVAMPTGTSAPVERRIWMTIVGSLRSQSFLWTISRRFDVTYRLTQSVTGDPVSIVSLMLSGPQSEVDGVVTFLRDQGINVEFGVIEPPARFTSTT